MEWNEKRLRVTSVFPFVNILFDFPQIFFSSIQFMFYSVQSVCYSPLLFSFPFDSSVLGLRKREEERQ